MLMILRDMEGEQGRHGGACLLLMVIVGEEVSLGNLGIRLLHRLLQGLAQIELWRIGRVGSVL